MNSRGLIETTARGCVHYAKLNAIRYERLKARPSPYFSERYVRQDGSLRKKPHRESQPLLHRPLAPPLTIT